MSLFQVTAPTVEPLDLATAKQHLRVETDDEDELIASLIGAATQYVESYTHRALITQTWDDKRDRFPCGPIWLPKPPVSAITSISYVDTAGATQTWAAANYIATDLPTGPWAGPAKITTAYAISYPLTRSISNAVTVRFVCGYGTEGSSVPEMIKACLKEHVRANYGRGVEDRVEIMQWIDRNLWPFKAFT